MNKDNASHYLPLTEALAEGKTIQVKTPEGWKDTKDIECAEPGAESPLYRIKPKAREWTLRRHWVGTMTHVVSGPIIKEETEVHVREILGQQDDEKQAT